MAIEWCFGKSRRLRIVRIPTDSLLDLLRLDGSRVVRFSGVPRDAKVVGLQYVSECDTIELVLESAEFPESYPGYCIPIIDVDVEERTVRSIVAERLAGATEV